MFRRHNRWHSRFDQPDPYDGSYDFTEPQSFNRYSYVQNDPVNFVDPTGLCGFQVHWTQWSDGTITYTTVWTGNCSVDINPTESGVGFFGSDFNFRIVQPTPDDPPSVGPGGPAPQEPAKPATESNAAKIAACCARCFNEGRLDNVIRDVGKATGHPRIGEFVAALTVVGTIASVGNEALNLTSLGRYPRRGVGGASRAGMPTTWQHTVGGSIGRSVRQPVIGAAGRALGRVAQPISLGMLAFEGGYWQGHMATCIAACTVNPSSF